MKKILSFILVFIFILSALPSYAALEEPVKFTSHKPRFARTNAESGISLLSKGVDIEEVLTSGWRNLEEEIDISEFNLTADALDIIYWDTYDNNPEFWYIGDYYYYWINSDGIITKVQPMYAESDPEVIEGYYAELNSATDEILFRITDDMSDFDKIMLVHDYMVQHYEYDYTYENHSITIMLTKTGVCESYACAFKYLMDKLGIECTYVSSDEMNHMWNLVKLGGNWYHIDLTWDDWGTTDYFGWIVHDYALLSTNAILTLGHYGFDLGGLCADDETYDYSSWHANIGSHVHLHNHDHSVVNNNIECSTGNVIFRNLDGGDGGWNIGGNYYLPGICYAALADHDEKLYFNSDTGIYEYDTRNEKLTCLKEIKGVCGLYVERNKLYYNKVILDEENYIHYVYGGEIEIDTRKTVRFSELVRMNNRLKLNVFKEDEIPTLVFIKDNDGIKMKKLTKKGLSKMDVDSPGEAKVFFWDANLKPYKPAETK